MSNENKKPIKIEFIGFMTLPEGINDFSQKLNDAVIKAAAIPTAILLDTESSHRTTTMVDTSILRTSFTLATGTLNCPCVIETPQQIFERKMRKAILDTVKEVGLHPDNVERIDYALKSKPGAEAINKLTRRDIQDTEGLIQQFLQIYRDVTK